MTSIPARSTRCAERLAGPSQRDHPGGPERRNQPLLADHHLLTVAQGILLVILVCNQYRGLPLAFLILDGIVALTGFMARAYSGASTTTVGDLMELDAIAAWVIGGTRLKGGRGTVLGGLFAAYIMASLLNGMTLMSILPETKFIVRGVVLVFAVWVDVKLRRR